jgi:RNA polymerase sigma-70 factor (ECF subfamily)
MPNRFRIRSQGPTRSFRGPLCPDKIYDQAWAKAAEKRVFNKLSHEHSDAERAEIFQAFLPYLVAEPSEIVNGDLLQRLKKDKATLQVIWHRLRRRFGEQLRREIVDTVEDPNEVGEEIRYLLAAWAAGSQTTRSA